MSYKPEVQTDTDPVFYSNALCFATEAEAMASACDLAQRWMLVRAYRAAESTDPVTHTYVNGILSALPAAVAA